MCFTLFNRFNMCMLFWTDGHRAEAGAWTWAWKLPVSINSQLADPESFVFVSAYAKMLNYS